MVGPVLKLACVLGGLVVLPAAGWADAPASSIAESELVSGTWYGFANSKSIDREGGATRHATGLGLTQM